MFGFTFKEMETTGSADRFPKRIEKFRKAEKKFPVLQHYFWWVMHNCITHFLIGIIPIKIFFKFHDWTSVKLNVGQQALSTPVEDLQACKSQAEKMLESLTSVSDNDEAWSIVKLKEFIDELSSDIEYHKNNGTDYKSRPFRKKFRLIFKEN